MKLIRSIGRFAAAVTLSCAAIATASAQDIIGRWDCGTMSQDLAGQGTISLDFDVTISADGVYEREGVMSIVMEALEVNASFSIMEIGSWTREGMELTTTTSEFVVEPAGDEAPSQMAQMIAQQMQASAGNGQQQTLTITSLTATTMTIDSAGDETTCERV